MKTKTLFAMSGLLATLVAGASSAQTAAPMSNLEAANGPIPGDVTLYADELACQQKIPTPGYFSSLNGAEISDSATLMLSLVVVACSRIRHSARALWPRSSACTIAWCCRCA